MKNYKYSKGLILISLTILVIVGGFVFFESTFVWQDQVYCRAITTKMELLGKSFTCLQKQTLHLRMFQLTLGLSGLILLLTTILKRYIFITLAIIIQVIALIFLWLSRLTQADPYFITTVIIFFIMLEIMILVGGRRTEEQGVSKNEI